MFSEMSFGYHRLFTTDPDGAQAFYAQLGITMSPLPLPAPARAAGAPSHWMGFAVTAIEPATAHLEGRGARRLGPAVGGVQRFRDPQGAVFSLAAKAEESRVTVAHTTLNTRDVTAAYTTYAPIFGWPEAKPTDGAIALPGATILPSATRPEVHVHWLFAFAIDDLDAALVTASEAGARYVERTTEGAYLEDPQGAVFALLPR